LGKEDGETLHLLNTSQSFENQGRDGKHKGGEMKYLLTVFFVLFLATPSLCENSLTSTDFIQYEFERFRESHPDRDNLSKDELYDLFLHDQIRVMKNYINELAPKIAHFEIGQPGYSPIHTNHGVFYFTLKGIENYLDGYKVVVEVTNPYFISF
jgi:hypothetical protein